MTKRITSHFVRGEAAFFVDQVLAGRMTLDEAREDIGISERTLTIWRQWLEWEELPRAMMSASIKLRRAISERFEQLLEERVRQTCQELDDVADAAPEPVEQPKQQVEVLTMQEEANGDSSQPLG